MSEVQSSPTMSRRSLLAALPFGGAALALPTIAKAENDTPVLRVFREWRTHYEWADGPATDGIGDAAWEPIDAKRHEIEERLFALPCQGPLDILAKLLAHTLNGEDFADDFGTRSVGILKDAKATVDRVVGMT